MRSDIAGGTQGPLSGQPYGGSSDGFVRKYDKDGAEIWTRVWGTGYAEQWQSIAADPTGVYVGGSANGPVARAIVRKYDHDGNALWTSEFGDPAGADAAVLKWDGDGNLVWILQFGTSGQDWSAAVAIGGAYLYVGGATTGVFEGQSPDGVPMDPFVAKLSFVAGDPPVPHCPADIVAGTDSGRCDAVVNYSATVTDNCPGATITCDPPSGSAFPIGMTPVVCTATDATGNTVGCAFTVRHVCVRVREDLALGGRRRELDPARPPVPTR